MVGTYVLSASLITILRCARVHTHDTERGILTKVAGKIALIEFPFERCPLRITARHESMTRRSENERFSDERFKKRSFFILD